MQSPPELLSDDALLDRLNQALAAYRRAQLLFGAKNATTTKFARLVPAEFVYTRTLVEGSVLFMQAWMDPEEAAAAVDTLMRDKAAEFESLTTDLLKSL